MSSSDFPQRLATDAVADAAVVVTHESIAREGARRALQKAIEDEVNDYIHAHASLADERGRRLVVRNGHKPPRTILTGLGPMEVKQPRVNDRRVDEDGVRFRFTSRILPPYLRKTKVIEELIPWLYLKGITTNDMSDALVHLGFDGAGLSPASVVRMKELWGDEHKNWSRRDLTGKRYVYLWADGLYFGCRLSDDRPCVLVIMGAAEGQPTSRGPPNCTPPINVVLGVRCQKGLLVAEPHRYVRPRVRCRTAAGWSGRGRGRAR